MESNQNLFDLHLDQQSFAYFEETAKWAKFIAIIGFVFCALMVVFALFAGTILATMFATMGVEGNTVGGMGGMLTFIYILFALLWFFPCLYLFRFASQMQHALQHNEQGRLQNSFRNLKGYFRFLGILFIVILSFYALGILGGVVAGLASL